MTGKREILRDIFGKGNFMGDVFYEEPMRNRTTLRIGGPAEIYAAPEDAASLKNTLIALKSEDIPSMPVGGGSNLLVSDRGIEGAIISTSHLNRIEIIEETDDQVRLFAEAGTPLQRLVTLSREKGYKGIEGLAGIPGFLGGAVRGNAGSFGFEIGSVIESVKLIDSAGRVSEIGRGQLGFHYRSSGVPEGTIVLGAGMKFGKDDARDVAAKVRSFLEAKRKEQPISEWSAGCVFKNPEGAYAGKLIDEVRCKGMKKGDVEVSDLHANFFINRGNGTASDFLALMEDVKERVMKSFGIELEPEIKIVGRRI